MRYENNTPGVKKQLPKRKEFVNPTCMGIKPPIIAEGLGCLFPSDSRLRIVPAIIGCHQCIRGFGPPAPACVWNDWMMCRQDIIERCPGGFYRILPREQRSVTYHGVMQQSFVRQFLSKMLFDQAEFPLVPDKFFSRTFNACGDSDGGNRGKLEAQVVGAASLTSRQKVFAAGALAGQELP